MHTMQEASVEGQQEEASNGHAYRSLGKAKGESRQQPDIRDTLLVVAGMLLPLLAQFGHAH
jgi:hypothetical protein